MNQHNPSRAVPSFWEERFTALEQQVERLQQEQSLQKKDNTVSLVCFSGEWDRLFAALSIASGALALGQNVHLFFTFWSVNALRAPEKVDNDASSTLQRMLKWLMPRGPSAAPLSKMNFLGMGKVMLRQLMEEKGVEDIGMLLQAVRELGAEFHLCDTSAQLFGLQAKELEFGDEITPCGVATFPSFANRSQTVLFI